MNTKPSKKGLYASVAGVVLTVLCCFTPILVITVGVVGLGALTPYLDYILFPALAAMLIVTFFAYRKWKTECETCAVVDTKNDQ